MSSFDGPLGDAALQDKMSDTGDIELWPPNLLAAGTSSTCVPRLIIDTGLCACDVSRGIDIPLLERVTITRKMTLWVICPSGLSKAL